MKALLCLLLTVCACFGQYMPMADPAWFGIVATPAAAASETFSPTNIAGYPAYVHYEVEGNYSTADGRACLTNLSANAGMDLTNLATGTTKQPVLVSNDLGTYDSLLFDGTDDYLKNGVYEIPASSQAEIFLVLYSTNTTASGNEVLSSTNGTYNQRLWYRSSSKPWINAGTGAQPLGAVDVKTNAWAIIDIVLNGANSTVYTNGVQGLVVDAGTGAGGGLTLGAAQWLGVTWGGKIAAMTIWRTNLGSISTAGSFCAGVRSNMFNFVTNRYGLSPL